jgi:hypothetical protein
MPEEQKLTEEQCFQALEQLVNAIGVLPLPSSNRVADLHAFISELKGIADTLKYVTDQLKERKNG